MTLPPGQRAIDGFPRFGVHMNRPAPRVPATPAVELAGAVRAPRSVPLVEVLALPRREIVADLHCVAGWSVTGLRWEGVPFAIVFERLVEPLLDAPWSITHVAFGGLDHYRSVVELRDALADDVLLVDRLGGRPLDADHGAPVRLVSPSQYGFISVKHLCRIDLHAGSPPERYHRSLRADLPLQAVKPHRRARVWEEERHRHLSAWMVRPVYRLLIPPIRALSARGSRPGP